MPVPFGVTFMKMMLFFRVRTVDVKLGKRIPAAPKLVALLVITEPLTPIPIVLK